MIKPRFIVYMVIGGALGLAAVPMLPEKATDWLDREHRLLREFTDSFSSPTDERADDQVVFDLPGLNGLSDAQDSTSLGELQGTTSTAQLPGTSEQYQELVELALELVNQDRAKHDLPPVSLGSSNAAQSHALDMLDGTYQSHWTRDGLKPYMIYSLEGGNGYVAENVGRAGWTDQEWEDTNCNGFRVNCILPDPEQAIRNLHWQMVYDDAHADWGHRDNILKPSHEFVNFGIAWDRQFVAFIQHFEALSLSVNDVPTITNGVLSIDVTLDNDQSAIGDVVSVYYDPLPESRSGKQLNSTSPRSYCLGGGYTSNCPKSSIRILPPLEDGWSYNSLDNNEIVADTWRLNDRRVQIEADLGSRARIPGIYTAVLWGPELDRVLLQYSIWVGGQA